MEAHQTVAPGRESWAAHDRVPCMPSNIALTLCGKWTLQNADVSLTHEKGRTIVRIPYRTFMPVVITL